MPLSSNPALFQFTFSHLPKRDSQKIEAKPAAVSPAWDFKTFGFFDRLRVVEDPERDQTSSENGDRYKRTLFGWGDRESIRQLLGCAKEEEGRKGHSGYLAVCLVKLNAPVGQSEFDRFADSFITPQSGRVAYLICLDAPDIIVLSVFGDATDTNVEQPLAGLLMWSEALRLNGPLAGSVERLLTIVACDSADYFVSTLSARDPDPCSVSALIRITDMNEGKALPELLGGILREKGGTALCQKLRTTIGYYDAQGEVSVPEVGRILAIGGPKLIERRALTTSTCFMSPVKQQSPGTIMQAPEMPLLRLLKEKHRKYKAVVPQLQSAGCLNSKTRELVSETVGRFERLNDTGLIPGSRLLIWTVYDAVASLTQECIDYINDAGYDNMEQRAEANDALHRRQRDYAAFLRAICDELDHRIALSLAAYTRFFPCSIEVPLKMVGALDMASRLIAASFRCYRCREEQGLLQVFIATAVKPTEFFRHPAERASPREGEAYPTLVLTYFSPPLIRHFYLALFIVLHEVAQCIIKDMIAWPCFTALVFAHTFAERIAVISTLAVRKGSLDYLPITMQDWANQLLTDEVAIGRLWQTMEVRVGPDHFVSNGALPAEDAELDWEDEQVWATDANRWRVLPVEASQPGAATKSCQLCRDARLLAFGEAQIRNPMFHEAWRRRLPLDPRDEDHHVDSPTSHGTAEDPVARALRAWSAPGVNHWGEYLELASLIPFLRLFESDTDGGELHQVVVGLIKDYWEVWRDSGEPAIAYDVARRFVIAEAAMVIFQNHLNGIGTDDDCRSGESNFRIMVAARNAATALLRDLKQEKLKGSSPQALCLNVWHEIATTGEGVSDERAVRAAEPLIVQCMVRFLVRLLHVFRSDGPNVLPTQAKVLQDFNLHGKDIFLSRRHQGKSALPVPSVNFLWSLQYILSDAEPEIGHLFRLEQVVEIINSRK